MQPNQIIKFISIFQLGLVIFFCIFYYLTRVFLKFKFVYDDAKKNKIIGKINSVILRQGKLSNSDLKLFKRNLNEFLFWLEQAEERVVQPENWHKIKHQLSNELLKPQSRKLAKSYFWFKRYLAVLGYNYGIDEVDNEILSKLVNDDVLLVSLNAAKVIFKYPSVKTVNALVDSMSKGRRVQRSFYTTILSVENLATNKIIVDIFRDRLEVEKNPYVKSFCYQILNKFSVTNQLMPQIQQDIKSDNVDLQIAALSYLADINNEESKAILLRFLNDPHWEVRATIVKLLGHLHDERLILLLEEKLHDSELWVRINSAQSLLAFGKKGIAILKRQSPINVAAYETAQKFLKASNNN